MQVQDSLDKKIAPSQKSKVAVVFTTPITFVEDINRLMNLANVDKFLLPSIPTLLKVNISWQHYFPACSTTPWQLEGVSKSLLNKGHSIKTAHNGTVVVNPREGAKNNKHSAVEKKLGIESLFLEEEEWIRYIPKSKMDVLDKVYPNGIFIPKIMIGKNICHLPTLKTHVFTTITGAMKNAFGGLLGFERHKTHSVIHQTLVDLLKIQKEIHPGIFAITDGTFAGDGPGPRALNWKQKNILIASSDQVAIDAVSATLMGFDPMNIPFIRIAHEAGLGCGEVKELDIEGEDISEINWEFSKSSNTFASWGQKLVYWGPLKPLEKIILNTPLVFLGILASNLFHNFYWLRFKGRKRIHSALKTEWGTLFKKY